MKKTLHSLALLLVWCLALAGGREARASHAQAGQISYISLGNNQYRIRVQFFRDCSGITPTETRVICKSGGCGTGGQTVTGTLVPVGQPVVGQPYCTSIQSQAPCSLTGQTPGNPLPNYAVYTYETATPVTLPPAAEWIISWEESARPSVRNLLSEGYLRLEARLNNSARPAITPRNPTGAGPTVTLQNNSPQFSSTNLPVPFVPVNQQTTISFAAIDAERDSLVYSLDGALNGCGTYETYEPYPSNNCQPVVLSTNPPCVLQCPPTGPNNTYSAQLPLPVAFDTVGTCPNKTVQPRFSFNAQQASFTFTANRYIAGATSASGDNKYVVVGKVTEYRKINGIYYQVGTSRRDFLVVIINGANFIPAPPAGQAGPPRSNATLNITRDTTDVVVYSCNYTRLRLNFSDPDNTAANPNNQNLTVFYPVDLASNILQSGDIGTFSVDRQGRPTPSITFYFQPTRATNGTRLLIPLRIEDDGCPIKGVQYRTVRVTITNDPRAAQAVATTGSNVLLTIPSSRVGTNDGSATICSNCTVQFKGRVDRPDSVRNVASGVVRRQTYRYQWSAVGAGGVTTTNPTFANGVPTGLPAVTNDSIITVRPRASRLNPTTRYRLSIDPTLGFGQNVCGDTTSYIVRVAPKDSINFVITDSLSNRPTGGGTRVPPITYHFKNTSFLAYPSAASATTYLIADSLGKSSGFKLDSMVWTYTRIKNGKGEVLNNSPVRFAKTTNVHQDPPALVLKESGTYLITLNSSFYQTVGLTNPARLAGTSKPKSRIVVVPNIDIYNVITPNGDNLNDTFVVGPQLQGGTLTIYNRWGRKVEELNNYQNTWGAQNQGPGVYYYSLTDTAGNVRKGWVEVIK